MLLLLLREFLHYFFTLRNANLCSLVVVDFVFIIGLVVNDVLNDGGERCFVVVVVVVFVVVVVGVVVVATSCSSHFGCGR